MKKFSSKQNSALLIITMTIFSVYLLFGGSRISGEKRSTEKVADLKNDLDQKRKPSEDHNVVSSNDRGGITEEDALVQEFIKETSLRVPVSLRERFKLKVSRQRDNVYYLDATIDNYKVSGSQLVVRKVDSKIEIVSGAILDLTTFREPDFPVNNVSEVEKMIENKLRSNLSRDWSIEHRSNEWVRSEWTGEWVPRVVYEVTWKDEAGKIKRESWHYNARTVSEMKQSKRVRDWKLKR